MSGPRTARCRVKGCESIAVERAVIGKGFVFEHFPPGCDGVPHRFVVPYRDVSATPDGQHVPRATPDSETNPAPSSGTGREP